MPSSIEPFDPTVPQAEVERLFRKLNDTRIPQEPIVPDAGDDYGPPLPWIHKLYKTWTTTYDWSAAQQRISSWPHYTTTIEDLRVHFLHIPAKRNPTTATPLLLIHGWPGTFYEFSRVIDPLTNPSNPSDPSFHLIIPSLPGFAWSQSPPRGWTLQDTARLFNTLMQRLGYDAYVAQGGDWGHWVVRELGARYTKTCKAVHTNMCPSVPPVADRAQWTDRERTAQDMTEWFLGRPKSEGHMSYAIAMRTRPQTYGVAFADSPVGTMLFVGEKYLEIVDPKYHDLEDAGFVHDLLTTVCVYFFTQPSIMTSMLCYYNNVRHEDYVDFNTREDNLIRAPFGFSSFRWDISPVSERAAATTGNLKWYRQHESGGHFAALESSEDFVKDLRDCFTKIYLETRQ